MKYVPLGRTGVKVSRICMGAMNFGGPTDEADAIKITHAALDAGVNFIDTADCYVHGKSEEIVGKAIKGNRDAIVLATKCWAPMGKGPNDCDGSRYHVMQSCEASLKRLQTDHIDLYIIHRPDRQWPGTPVEETLSAMTDLVRQGKVRYIGTSTFNAWRLVEAQWAARTYNLERYCSEQLNYSIMNRFVEKDILRVCDRYGIGVTVWSPLNWGWLSGKYRRGKDIPEGSRAARGMRIKLDTPEGQKNLDIVEKLAPLAEQRDLTLSQFSLAWLLKNPVVTSVICGPRLLSHFEDNVAADDAELDDEAMAAVDKICPPNSGDGSEWW